MSGYRADLDAITAARGALLSTVDTLAVGLDSGACASLGPDRLAAAAAAVIEEARAELDRVRRAIAEDAELVAAAGREYAEADRAAAELLARRAGEPG
jgi:hypothetical protein